METKRRGTASTPAHANLRDGLLRDTLPRAVENDLESYQTVIENISTYVEMVYHQKYTSDLMQFIGLFLTNIARRTADWSTFDPSPLLLMASTVIQHNKSQCRELLIPLETFIRSTFIRSNISVASIDKVLQVTTSLYRKSVEPDQMLSKNQIALAIVELLYDGLVGKARITPVTLTSLMEALVPDKDKETHFVLPADTLTRLADVGLYYLNPDNGEASSNMDFTASQAVAKMVLTVSQERPSLLSKIAYPDISNQHPKPRNPSMTIRAWNLILLSAASCPSGAPAQMLLTFLPSFASEYSRCLRPYSQMETAPQDMLHFDVNRAYASIRLWLILCRKAASGDHDILGGTWDNPVDKETLWSRIVWNELWPPLETVVHALPTDIQIGSLAALASSVASSVADLFLFLRQMQCVVSTEVSSQITLLSRLRVIKRAEAKINRALRSLSEAPTHVPLNSTIAQIQTEIHAEERLEAAGRQDAARVAPERMRRIAS
ncbi:hypothetical protein QCA50_002982 [Cerrena zonata]|uniref:Uncharacterized protein n=1 Tax=Cerrena zonata TaxID=2478898 RepID=A0AAW0GV90_9APHY